MLNDRQCLVEQLLLAIALYKCELYLREVTLLTLFQLVVEFKFISQTIIYIISIIEDTCQYSVKFK